MLRERDHLARHGYVTLHIDYRNHAQSDRDPSNDANLRAGYTVDAINAGLALKKARFVDPEPHRAHRPVDGRRGRLQRPGRTPGALPRGRGLRAGELRHRRQLRQVGAPRRRHGPARRGPSSRGSARPRRTRRAWAATSPRTYFGRITEPLLIHHGTADEDCPLAWSRESVAALRAKGKEVELFVYPGGRHTLTSPQWDTSIRRTEAFLAQHLT